MEMLSKFSRRSALRMAASVPLAAGLGLSANSSVAQQAISGSRCLVVCLSRTGNTRVIAHQIRRARQADFFEIETAKPYPEDYEAMVKQAQEERDSGYEPALKATVSDITLYETIFLGFPIWGTTAPSPVRSFLSAHDLSGKSVVPFVTHGGYGPGDSLSVVSAHMPGARLLDPFTMKADQERETLSQVSRWLRAEPG